MAGKRIRKNATIEVRVIMNRDITNKMLKLRPYQEECCSAFWSFVKTNKGKNPLLVLPTGTGKSVIIAEIIRRFYELDNNASVLMLTHVSELVKQNFDKF